MIDNIAPLSQIAIECKSIQTYLEISVSDEPAEIEQRGNDLSVYMARSGKLLADAKYHKDLAVKDSILKRLDVNISASALNKLIDADCHDENYYVNWMERINRTATHQMDWIRSVLSKIKQEMAYQNFRS